MIVALLLLVLGLFSHQLDAATDSISKLSESIVSVENFRGLHISNGILIGKDVVLTSAHSVNGVQDNLSVRVGSKVLGFGGELVKVAKNCPITGYDFLTKNNDIAVLRLVSPVKSVLPAKLPEREGLQGKLSAQGWGFNTQGSLGLVAVEQVGEPLCKKVYGNDAIKEGMVCLRYRTGRNSCLDIAQGSPVLNKEGVVVAINAALGACDFPGVPGVFTKIPVSTIQEDIDKCTA